MYYLVYGLFYILSLLPIRALYILSDFIYALVYYVFGYRKKVVMENLLIAFPEKNGTGKKKDREKILPQFCRHLYRNDQAHFRFE